MVKFLDLTREYKIIGKQIDKAISRVIQRGSFVLGPELKNFEKKFADYCGTKYCLGVNSGTDALFLSLLCAGVGRGNEVIVPVNTAVPTAIAVLMSGARPVFVDCDENFLLDIKQIPKLLNKKTKAIIPVHLYGAACDMEKLSSLAKSRKLLLIEDCAQAAGAEWRGKKVGSFGDFGCFSFYPTKNLGAYGDGGAITVNNKKYYDKLRMLRFYGQPSRGFSLIFGINTRLDEIQAAILKLKLKCLDSWNKRRQEIAGLYAKLITNPAVILPNIKNANDDNSHVYHLFVMRVKQRDRMTRYLQKKGVDALIHFPSPLAEQPTFSKYKNGKFSMAKTCAKETISIPLHPFLQNREVIKISKIINNFKP